jgi:hypothetical protein
MALVRIVLIGGGSVIANWDPSGIAGRGSREEVMVTLTSEEAVDRLAPGRVEAILPVDKGVPIPGGTAIYRFATLA